MAYTGYGGMYGGGGYGYGGGYGMYPSSVLGSGYFGSYIYNNAGGYSTGSPVNPAMPAPALNEAQVMPMIDFPLYHGPSTDDGSPEHRPSIFSERWLHQTSGKEKTVDLLLTGVAMIAIGVLASFASRGIFSAPWSIAKAATGRP